MKTHASIRRLVAATAAWCCALPGPRAAEAIPEDSVVTLEKFEIVGTRPRTSDATTLKLPATILETPRSVSVFDASRLREQDIQTGGDLLFWVPGLNTNGAVAESYHFYARGYRMAPNDWRVDGFAGRVTGGSYSPSLFGVEQVSVLKGPAGLLYGSSGSPGGMINLVSKKPREVAATTVETRVRTLGGGEVGFGERVSHEFEVDATGPVTRDGRLLYRALGSVERNAFAAQSPADDNQFYRLAFTCRLDAAGRFEFTPSFEWSREDRAQRAPTLSPGSSRTTNDGRTDYTLADVNPRSVNLVAGGRVDTNRLWGADLTAKLSDAWRASVGFRYSDRDYRHDAFALNTATLKQTDASDPRAWTVARRHSRAANTYRTTSIEASTTYEFARATNFKSRLQLGLNGRRNLNTAASSGNGPDQSPVNIHTGVATSALVANAPALAPGNRTDTFVANAFAQSQAEILGRTVLTVGFAHARETNRTTTATGVVTEPPARRGSLQPNAALVYRLTRAVALYGSYSTSFSLTDPSFEDAQGRTGGFAPTEGENCEVGAKAAFWGNLLAASVSVFDTELNGVLVQSQANELNSRGNRFYRQLDNGRKARGVEAEFTVSPVPAWDTTFTYALIDAFDRGASAALPHTGAEMTPRHAVSVYSRYAFLTGPLQGLSARAGLIWQGERWAASRTPAAPDPLRLSSFHRIDAGLGYQLRQWRVALSVENLTNEYYLLAGATGLAFSPVNPRSYSLRLSRTW
jgi:outer membrane receptor for ferric coprogen and ferric-rhodotorulic acid